MKNKLRVCAAAAAAAAAAAGAGAYIALDSALSEKSVVRIMSNGEEFAVIDLAEYTDGRSTVITVPSQYNGGENTLEIKDGTVRVIEATCPDKICIEQGRRGIGCKNPAPITCLPNRMTVTPE